MNVLVIGKFDRESFGRHISQTLQAMGHSTIEFPWGVQYTHSGNKLAQYYNKFELVAERFFWNTNWQEGKAMSRINQFLKRGKIDFTIVTHDMLRPAEVDRIKSVTGAPIVIWYPDHIGVFDKHMFLNADYDAVFFKEPYIVRRLNADFPTRNFYYLPECCNPIVHKVYEPEPGSHEKFTCDITTAGNLYANRIAFFEQLADMHLDIRIWGNPASRWMNVSAIRQYLKNEYVIEKQKSFAFGLARIVLNNLHPCEVEGINCRAFEIPAMGGFQLINWREGLADLLEPGEEVVAFHDMADLKDKIRFYLGNESERNRIRQNGLRRAHAQHTYTRRLELMFDTILGSGKGFPLPKKNELAPAKAADAPHT